jgi:DNA-binding NarL/FixJ family response regulator
VGDIAVLVVDDHPAFRDAAHALVLATPGFASVAEVATGADGIRIAAQRHPDFALIDVDLPDMSGFETCDAIRVVSPETFIVFISANDDAGQLKPERCSDQPFVPKRDLRPAVLRRLWEGHAGLSVE